MAKHRKHRGVSLGTVMMLAVTCLVLLGMGSVLPRLYEFLEGSFFGEFFYRANVFLSLIPGT